MTVQLRKSLSFLDVFAIALGKVIGLLVLAGQGALSFSDIDRVGWTMVVVYVALVLVYVRFRRLESD